MTWSLANSQCDEASKIRWEAVPYFHGRVLDVGCGKYKCYGHWIGVDNGGVWGKHNADAPVEDAANLDLFASQSCDGVFSSHLLEHFQYERVPDVLAEWLRVIKQGGHLMLYVPDGEEYPKCGTEFANPDHKFDCSYENIVSALEKTKYSWDIVDFQKRNETDEYSLWFVVKKL